MNRIRRSFLPVILAACTIFVTSAAYANCFGYFDCQDEAERRQNYDNQRSRYEESYNTYQRFQRQSDNLIRQEENLSRDYRQDIRQYQQSRGYMRNHRR